MNARLRPCAEISRRTIISSAVWRFEDRFDGGQVFTGADEVGGGAAADEQADGAHQDALACPGFAGQDGEARPELQLEAVDDCKVLDAQKAEHGPEVPSYQMFDSP